MILDMKIKVACNDPCRSHPTALSLPGPLILVRVLLNTELFCQGTVKHMENIEWVLISYHLGKLTFT